MLFVLVMLVVVTLLGTIIFLCMIVGAEMLKQEEKFAYIIFVIPFLLVFIVFNNFDSIIRFLLQLIEGV